MSEGSAPAKKIKAKKERRPPKKITENYLHNAGLYYLERFVASTAHFRTVMMRKIDRSCNFHKDQDREQCIAMLDAVAAKFQELGLLNDETYTRGMVISMRRRGLSARMIHAKLRAKGLEQSAISEALQIYDDETDENAELRAALRLARRKKLGPYATEKNADMPLEKSLASLARAGFSYDTASRALQLDRDEAERISESGGC